jgi:hypothetical protein
MNDDPRNARFSATQVKDGPWVVVDDANAKRLLASCPNRNAALMIAALMNGNTAAATKRRRVVIDDLDRFR